MFKNIKQLRKARKIKKEAEKVIKKSTKIIKSVVAIMLIIITINTLFVSKRVNAQEFSELDLYSKENLYCFKYRGVLYRCEYVVYNHEGKEYPAYCLNRELYGVSLQRGGYKVELENLITNELVWKAIINGYPYKTYQELGCNNEMEAFAATKLAAYDMMYNYNLDEFIPVNDVGKRVVAAIKNISYIARNSTQTKITPQIELMPQSQQWQVDNIEKQYISKVFKINANSEMKNCIIQTDNKINGEKITDINNNIKYTFESGEEFKILIPIKQLNCTQQMKIMVNADAKTYPIYYGKAPENLQNYAISGIEYEKTNSAIIEQIPKNETSLKIKKIDSETQEPLENFEFSIVCDEKNTNLITNKQGIIEQFQILPGEYIITEKAGTEDYVIKQEPITTKIEFNQQYEIVIKNDKKIIEKPEEKIVETPEQETVQIPIKLPKTGF